MNQQEILAQLTTLTTETINQNSTNIDVVSTLEKLTLINQEDQKVALAISLILADIAGVVDLATETIKNGGRLIYFGAGTSGRLGILDAVECPPTYGVDYNTVVGVIAGGDKAFIKAQEGAEDSEDFAINDLKNINVKVN